MMNDLHIEDFYRDVAMIFLQLYNHFPRKTILYVDDISGPDTPDEFGLHSDRFLSCFSTMVWLGEQDYLRFDAPIRQEALDQVVLSEKGFLLLSSRSELTLGIAESGDEQLPPSVMEQSRSNISQVRFALQSGSSIIIKQCVHHLLSK